MFLLITLLPLLLLILVLIVATVVTLVPGSVFVCFRGVSAVVSAGVCIFEIGL